MSTATPRMDVHTLIESLPAMLGYTPQRSIVVVGLTATRALGGCMRVDMPEPTMTDTGLQRHRDRQPSGVYSHPGLDPRCARSVERDAQP